jgi:hypothetical protein
MKTLIDPIDRVSITDDPNHPLMIYADSRMAEGKAILLSLHKDGTYGIANKDAPSRFAAVMIVNIKKESK